MAQPTPADYARRLAEARAAIAAAELDSVLVASQHNRRYLTGFSPEDGDITESVGWALVTPRGLYLITGTFSLISLEHEIVPSGAEPLLTDTTPAHRLLATTAAEQGLRRLGFEQAWISYARWDRVRRALADVAAATELVPCDDLLARVRARKDEAEITTIRRAAEIANDAFTRLLRELRPSMTERQVAFRLEELMRLAGAEGPSFPSIVACGPGGALPHAVPTECEIQAGEPLLLDFGCRVDGYCSDLTRTVCLGEPSEQLRQIYGIVRAAQSAAEDALASGMRRGRDVDAAARRVIADAGYGAAYLHSLGHGVGMAVHELPGLLWPRNDDPDILAEIARQEGIEEGAVVTIEPGIYLEGWGGVRLEDMAVVRAGGIELLGGRNPEEIVRVPLT
jgi:Xaa-Pro aminopeptidase